MHRADPSLIDADVLDAISALARHYHSEEEQRTPSPANLGERAQRVFQSVQEMCEWRLGRRTLSNDVQPEMTEAVPVSGIVRGLREIQKSIPKWTKQRGRKGYLEFVSEFLP